MDKIKILLQVQRETDLGIWIAMKEYPLNLQEFQAVLWKIYWRK